MTVWRWHVTMTTSILHRASGAALYGGALILAAWAVSLASGPEAYACFQAVAGSILGQIVLFGLTLSAFYHLAKGLQHLTWDSGRGLNIKTASASSWLVIVVALVATLIVWALVLTGAFA